MRSYKTRASSPVAALLWENWRLTYLAFFVALALGAGVTHSLAEMQRLQLKNAWVDSVSPSYAICCFALFMYGAIVLFSLADPKALSTRIPSRHYCLPMRTGTMVAVHLVYRVASFSLLAVTLFALMRVEFGEFINYGIVSDMAIAITIFSYVLAVAWSWGAVRPVVTAVLVVALPLLAIGVALKANGSNRATPNSVVYANETYRFGVEVTPENSTGEIRRGWGSDRESAARAAASAAQTRRRVVRIEPATEVRRIEPSTILLGLFLIAAVHLAIAYVAGIRGRMGTIASERSEGIAARIFGSGPRITSSAQQAQVWYEWRRKGLVLPGLTLCFSIAILVFVCIAEGGPPRESDLAAMLVIIPIYASVFAAFFTGLYMLSVDYRHASSGLSTFLYTRPLSTDAYTRARLRMSVKSVLMNLFLCLVPGLIGLILMGDHGDNWVSVGSIDSWEVAALILASVAYGLLLWSLLWMSVPVLVYLLWFGCYFYYQTLVGTEFAQVNEHINMFWLIWIPAVVLVAVTAAVWQHPAMWRSLSSSTVARARHVMLLALVAMGACAWAEGIFENSSSEIFERFTIVMAIVGLSTLPALSILSQPLLLDRLRRR